MIQPLQVLALVLAAPSVSVPPQDGWMDDVQELVLAVEAIHPDPYRVHPRERWEAEKAARRARYEAARAERAKDRADEERMERDAEAGR